MPATTRIRGKSAVHSHGHFVHAAQAAPPVDIQTFNLTNHPLLKIESVVPTIGVNSRHSRLIRRSHSTLSSVYLRKVVDPRSRTVASTNRTTNGTVESDLQHAQEEHQKTTTAFPRIKRPKKEREKFPDRINLDRKGVTAIPLIEDEPQLRLLSLQHNLINIFHVPEASEEIEPEKKLSEETTSTSLCSENGVTTMDVHRQGNQPPLNMLALGRIHQRPINIGQLHNSRHRLGVPGSGFVYNPSTSTTPAILINGVPNYYSSRSLTNGKPLQLLNVNQKLIIKKNQYVQSLYQQRAIPSNGKTSVSDSGIRSISSNGTIESGTSPLNSQLHVEQCPYGETLQNLVFLDLYNNQIEKIGNLDGLKSLSVLLLGKNRIADIEGIVSLRNSLRVLDLHGNRISNISHKICRLQELKSLNLAGNTLRQIYSGDLCGLQNLRELNLKRNRIKRLSGFDDLQHLERLWLCNNDIQRVEDMSCIAKAINLKEITVENNPVSLAGDCCSFLVSYLPSLVMLSQMHVTEQVKRAAMAWRKSKESSDLKYASISSDVGHSIRREEVISNARTNWELLRSQPQFVTSHKRLGRQGKKIEPSLDKPRSPQIQQPVPNPKVEGTKQKNDSQESFTDLAAVNDKPQSSSSTEGESTLRLPPILDPNLLLLDNLLPTIKTDNVSVEDSLGANVDSASIFSGSSSSSSSRSPSSCRSSRGTTSELDDLKSSPEFEEKKMETPLQKDVTVGEEDVENVSVEFRPEKDVLEQNLPSAKRDDLKMPIIRISEGDHPIESRSTVPNLHTLNTTPIDEPSSANSNAAALRSIKNRCTTSRKLLPPSAAQPYVPGLLTNRTQTAKPTANSVSATLLVVNNNSNNSTSNMVLKSGSSTPGATTTGNTNALQQVGGVAKSHTVDREREQGGDYLIEICGRYLNVYGVGALKFVDKQWNVQKAGDVHTVKFSYINFNNISGILGKIKSRFPNAEHFVFRETNITCLGQLNSLAEIQGLQSIVIESEGNLICTKKWRNYAIFRLSHWGLKQINGQDIAETETEEADRLYGRLPDLVLWSLPETLLAPLLSRLRLEEPCQASRLSAKDWLMQAEPSLKCVVGKEALQWRKSPTGNCNNPPDEQVRTKGKLCFSMMMENACNAAEKMNKLETLWPSMLSELVRNTLIDYSQLDTYVKNLQKSLPL